MKLYVVSSYGGEWEDSWEHLEGVCSTLEVAEKLKHKIEELHNKVAPIPEDVWDSMMDELYSSDFDEADLIKHLYEMLPEYSKADIEQAYKVYERTCDNFAGVNIEEIELFETISDVAYYNGTIY